MPSQKRFRINLRGTDEWAAAVEKLAAKVGAASLNDLAEHAIRELAERHKVKLPDRMPPHGGARERD